MEISETALSEYTSIIYSVEDRIARITLNRPDKRNAINTALRLELLDALKAAESDDEIRVILIEGAGAGFCSGYDLSPDRSDRPSEYKSARWFDGWTDQVQRTYLESWMAIWDLLKPVVAKVHGACLAGGTELMSMCDIAFVADDARLGYPAMRGLSTPDVQYFPWKLPMSQAKYLQLTGNSVSGKRAAEIGWVAKSFPADQLEDATMRELRALGSIEPDILAANKLCLNQTYEIMGIRTALATGAQWHTLSSPAYRPGGVEFIKIAQEQGLKAAFEWRDAPFRREGID
ncbi:enoyl-CoA hydratase [Mycobacterium sp. NAZ190054]|nr:enoyl-CoA hydratase [Mycobacterium sp. NAZ190054]